MNKQTTNNQKYNQKKRKAEKWIQKASLTYCQRICISRISKSSRENAGLVLHFGTVIIDGVYGITEEFCNLRTVVDTQTNQGENAEFRIQQLAFTEHDAFFGLQQVIEFIDKIGEKVQERQYQS